MISGVINVYKEAGYTSHDVVAKLRGILHQKKIGHTGTLDPDAVGVLPVCLGKATKLAETLAEGTKTYETVLLLGRETDTQDISGIILSEKPVTCTEEEVRTVLADFLGEQLQIPPMYSARKQNGKRLYQLAREGIVVERKPARIRIDEMTVLFCELPRVGLRITCSKGTYIRTLCHDIGKRLGCAGCMEKLTRTRVGRFTLENACTLHKIEESVHAGKLQEILISIEAFFAELPAVQAAKGTDADRLIHNGNPLPAAKISEGQSHGDMPCSERVRVYDSEGTCMGVYKYKEEAGAAGSEESVKAGAYYPEIFIYEPSGSDR